MPCFRPRGRGTVVAALAVALLLPGLWGWGALRLAGAGAEMVPGVSVRIVQPNISQEQKWREDNARAIFDQLKQLSAMPTQGQPEGIGGITHLVWPESAVPFLIDESPVARAELQPLLGGRTTLITGAIRRDRAMARSPTSSTASSSSTARRSPSPAMTSGGSCRAANSCRWAGCWSPWASARWCARREASRRARGPRSILLPGGLKAALLVCYEVIFPDRLIDAADRPQLIINVTNDGWFGRSTGPWQHLAQTRLRAIEQGLPVIRAANTGISAVIDSHGRYIQRLPLLEQG